MKKTFNWIAIVICLLPLAYLAFIWKTLPEVVPVHFDIHMKPDETGSKMQLWTMTGVLAGISIGVYLVLKNIYRIDPRRVKGQSATVFHKLAFGIVVFIAALSVLIIRSVQNGSGSLNLLFPLIGLLFAFLGNNIMNIKPNYFAGIRLPWTLSDDENWRKTHRLGGKLWFAGGMLIGLTCLFLPPPAAFVFFISVTAVMVLIPVVYSYRLFKKKNETAL